ncbi:hypothetical protein D8674_042977 [Pyrus ussuriensis x Pyrus communis]|uniref:Uncharacterized protein n=1 Tax=Pyrus ussuriensis x Pyrus communis TaxID=2448454 RepID=A0A5N5FBN6_9ROSA|nr:hypothetical protein D8674_043033 [Pyrus ussuriensis x Pyrus communis]KAB2612092.1 hypothetical protein D8674_042977 [Pyrus ussuriensis x Pyrus communis]
MMASINKTLAIDANILMFFDRGMEDFHSRDNDPFIVKVQITNAMINRVLVDNKLGVNPYNHLVTSHVMDCPTPHNAILGWNWLHKMKVVPSCYHQLLCYPTLVRYCIVESMKMIRNGEKSSNTILTS